MRAAMGRFRRQVLAPGETPAAAGEIVWSWRRDPGATPAETILSATGARKAASPGRAGISRKTIARGKPSARLAEPVVTMLVCFFHLQTRLRVRSAPGFPCALFIGEGATEMQPRAKPAAGTRACISMIFPVARPPSLGEQRRKAGATARKVTLSDHLLALRPLVFLV